MCFHMKSSNGDIFSNACVASTSRRDFKLLEPVVFDPREHHRHGSRGSLGNDFFSSPGICENLDQANMDRGRL